MKCIRWIAAVLSTTFLAWNPLLLAQSSFRPATNPSNEAGSQRATAEPPPTAPLPAGMTRLFNGKTLDGWIQVPANTWTVKDCVIASLGAGRGVIYTAGQYDRYRIIFDVRHISGQPDHQACVLVFCTAPAEGQRALDALGGIQFQVPNGGHWDYRKGHNNSGKGEFTAAVARPKFDPHQWSRVEIMVDAASGTARMAVAQPVGSRAIEIVDFKDSTAGRRGPFALQMHNRGLFDDYANIAIEVDPTRNGLITTEAIADR